MNYLNSDRIHYRIKSKNPEKESVCPMPYIAASACASVITAGVIAFCTLCAPKKEKGFCEKVKRAIGC